ncbi:hypothetical protein SCAR479_12486 [Seiridium cardinale]|uniref:Uncharacterized protein n=1 Tax=Seiridium cardinale TaxID=138064 RepID=A0ABR2XAJ6_9PEZI
MWETSEEFEPLRVCNVCVEGLRAGNAGEGCRLFVFVREGKAGGARRPETASGVSRTGVAAVERRGSAGAESLSCGLVGIAGIFGAVAVPFPLGFGTCASDFGRPGGGGGDGLFLGPSPWLLKFFCALRAAIRSARLLNLGSSTSAIAFDFDFDFDFDVLDQG